METAAKRVHAGDPIDDRLSDLPDDLLHHVLSFIPSQQAVQMSFMSKRWSGLWRSVPCIDITIDVDSPRYGRRSYSKEKWEKADNFIDNLLMLHDAPTLDAFRINIGSKHEDLVPTIDRWVCRAIKRRPLDISIAFCMNGTYKLPHLGSSTSLLRKLYLLGVSLDDSFEEQLRSQCPVLEDLTLNDCCTYFREIQSGTLRKLVLRDCRNGWSKMLVIRAPALVSFTIVSVGSNNGVTLDGPMNYLVSASIFPFDRWSSIPSQVSLLGSLFNVTNLELIRLSAEVMLHKKFDKYPTFMNLKTLSMYGCLHSKPSWVDGCLHSSCDPNKKLEALARLLHKAPNLERLILENCCCLQDSKQKITASDLSLRSLDRKAFDCPNLKFIEIKYRDDERDDEHHIVSTCVRPFKEPTESFCYFLQNLKNLVVPDP